MVRPFSKTGRHFVYKRYYHSKSKSKAVLRRRWDGGTVVLRCENWHFILTATVLGKFGQFLDENGLEWSLLPSQSSHTLFEALWALIQKLTVMLVAAGGLPDKRAGAPTSSMVTLTTGNKELRTTLPNQGPLAYLYCFLELNFSSFRLYMNIIKS